jgi:maltokinase
VTDDPKDGMDDDRGSSLLPEGLMELVPGYLGAQRWFAGTEAPSPDSIRVERSRELWAADELGRRLWQAIVGVDEHHYHLLIGERPAGERADFLHGHEDAVLGALESRSAYFYDAILDGELARVLLEVASEGTESANIARPLSTEQSNSSLVYDDRLILKIFRRLHEGGNPDMEVTSALAAAGFAHVPTPLVTWRDLPYDLAFGQQFLSGASEGWALALTSLRDLYSSASGDPAEVGGDFAGEARRLGSMTAEMHLALDEAFGRDAGPNVRAAWLDLVDDLEVRLAAGENESGTDLLGRAALLLSRLRAVGDPGPAIRVHGDFHLGQVMAADDGWYVLDFEGEPARSVAQRTARMSPLKDVSSMLRSFDYASRYVLLERAAEEAAKLEPVAMAWESRNRQAFIEGYGQVAGIQELMPGPESRAAVMFAYELDKALYELEYERSHRPEWVPLPMNAIDRLVDGGGEARE